MENTLYKCRARIADEYGNLYIKYDRYVVIGETDQYYIIRHLNKRKKVSKDSKNGFAFDTKQKALFNFLKRRERYAGFLTIFAENNEKLIELIKHEIGNEVKP